MKRFHFPLDRVREWREKQVTLEEVRLEHLVAERKGIIAERETVIGDRATEEALVLSAKNTDSLTLRALGEFRAFAARRLAALERDQAGCETRIVEQRGRVMEAQRKVKLLDKLRQRRYKTWSIAFDKELEEQAAEAHRSKRL